MRISAEILIILAVITLLVSCHEVYYPDGLDAESRILIVEGYIDDGQGPYTVKLHWATVFTEDEYEAVPDATVTISDNYGNSEILKEHYNGSYLSTDGIIEGIPGREYTLRVELEDGSIYESEPTLMQWPDEIDKLYAEPGTKEVETRNYSGEYKVDKSIGLFVYADLKTDSAVQGFFRFNSKFVVQREYLRLYKPDTAPKPVYLWWTGRLNDELNIGSALIANNESAIKKHDMGFLPYHFDWSEQSDTHTIILPTGWAVVSSAYSITENAYEFYNSILTQIHAENRIFDPIPSQVKGNMRCSNDTTKQVFGLFEVASRTVKNTGFYWVHWKDTLKIVDLQEYTPPIGSGRQDSIPPDFWITFD